METSETCNFVVHLDDEKQILETFRHIFEESGFKVDSFTDPSDAFNAIQSSPKKYSLIVSDFHMTPMNGIEFFKKLKAHDYFNIKHRAILSGEVGTYHFTQKCQQNFDITSDEIVLFSKINIKGIISFLKKISYQYPLGNEGKKEFYRLEKQALMKGFRPEEEFLLEDCLFGEGQNVLDAGCGSGIICRMLALINAKKNVHFHGIEVSKETAFLAQKRIEGIELFSNITLTQANLENVPYPDESFDAIICRYVYEHMANPQQVTDEFFRLLRPGGKLMVIDSNGLLINIRSNHYPQINEFQDKLAVKGIPNFDFFINDNLPSYLERAGFNVGVESMIFREIPIIFRDDESRQIEKSRLKEVFENAKSVLVPVLGGENELDNYINLVNKALDDSRTKFKYDKRFWKIIKP